MNDPVQFTTEYGVTVRVVPTAYGVTVHLRMEQDGDGREASFQLTVAEAQTMIRGLGVVNECAMIGAWGWKEDHAIHIPSYNEGHADAVEEFGQ